MQKGSENLRNELLVLEEHFLDETRFKISALLSVHAVQRKKEREIASFIKELERITHENILLITNYAAKDRS